ncbi:MAG: PfkB family carbohydrate kinase [Candidatus Paceibacterota bacterium]|jgi:sugar/nucleoside kinase (ribokinase family)
MNNDSPFDFIGIGDTVMDAFIKLEVGHTQETASGAELCVPYGAKIPYESVTVVPAVGNSANAVVSAARLGVKSALVSFLGEDNNGKECLARFEKEGVGTQFITQEAGKKTNYHYVLWYKDDRTILVKHDAFKAVLPDIGNPKWVYFSSIGPHAKNIHFELVDYIESHPDINIAFQPGTFQLTLKNEIANLYKKVSVLCVNKEEAEFLTEIDGSDIKKLLDKLEAFGPKTVIITDGARGAFMKYENTYFNMPIYPDIAPPYDRTGAGDAFFSTFVSYLAKGYDAPYAIKRAPINSMNVVQYVGAQEGLLSEETIEDYLKKAPDSYKLTILE